MPLTAVATCAGVAAVVHACTHHQGEWTHKEYATLARTLVTFAWPHVLFSFLHPDDRRCPALLPSILWMYVSWGADAFLMHHAPPSGDATDTNEFAGITFDPTVLIPLSFGLCNLSGARPDAKYTSLLVGGILMSMAVLVPRVHVAKDTETAFIVAEVRHAMMRYAIGFLLAGVCLTRMACRSSAVMLPTTGPRI